MTSDQDALHERIAERAHGLWEGAGRPHDRSVEFWHQARDEIEREPEEDDPLKTEAFDR